MLRPSRQRAGQLTEAMATYRESLKVKDRAIVHVALARMFLARKDRPAAEKELAAALESASGSDVREMSEVAALLSDLDRKPDALRILASLAASPEKGKPAPGKGAPASAPKCPCGHGPGEGSGGFVNRRPLIRFTCGALEVGVL